MDRQRKKKVFLGNLDKAKVASILGWMKSL
jgi:hypothetical protein